MEDFSELHLNASLWPVNTGYTYSTSSSYSSAVLDSEKEHQIVSSLLPPIMSRRSLRLHSSAPFGDDGLLDRSLPSSSTSFSPGGAGHRNARPLKSRRSQQLSVSCAQSLLLQTPRRPAGPSLLSSSLHSAASDASLLSSMLDESTMQDRTLVDGFWGLDQDVDPKESTVLSEHSAALANSTLIGSGEERCSLHQTQTQTQTSTLRQHYCRDCDPHSIKKEVLTSHYPSSRYTASSSFSAGARGAGRSAAGDPGSSTIYCRDKSRRSKTGVLQSLLDSFLPCGRRAAASVWSVLAQVFQAGLTLTTQLLLLSWNNKAKTEADTGSGKVVYGAHSSYCGVMNLKEAGPNEKQLGQNGSLCDDCKEKHSETQTVTSSSSLSSSSWSSVASYLLGLMWSATAFTERRFSSLARIQEAAVCCLVQQPDSRFLPNLLRLLLVLLPLLLLLSLCWWGPAGLLSVLPAVNLTDWRTALPVSSLPSLSSVYLFTSARSRPAEKPAEESREVQSYVEPPFTPPLLQAETPIGGEDEAVSPADSARLLQLERSLSGLWERVEAGGRRADQRHGEVLQMYRDLRQQLPPPLRGPGDDTEPWLTGLLEHRLDRLRGRLDQERLHREQTQQQYLEQQQSQAARLAQLELLLQELAAKTEQVQQRQEAAATVTSSATTLPAPVSAGVDPESHDALLAEVVRLEAALGSVRQDLQGLTGCQDRCERLDSIQETISAQVSAQVREELRSLFYGNQLTTGGEASGDPASVPDSLLQWLSERFVSGADLHAALASLELGILQDVSRQLEREKTPCTAETVEQTVEHAARAAGAAMTQEEIHQIVENALRLYSQDRTGLADYALESGGGSILSTRCSESYETRTALMTLFGIPLWYFSQSPRAVIQPDVHPGSCWAFRGSTGYLVIRLSMRILPTAFSLEHIPKALAPSGTLRSAPRDFTVYGLDDESQEDGKLLGRYTYEEDGEALQTYTVSEENDRAFQIIELQVLSNWGHQEYTCVYRFRVHGKPRDN
ncbi:SUN domain-containing protein 1-like [Centroberyx affinis]|uniref:SUN domain-containing protein 1-like n=1 Tax=Centroberyx affinis TaxID=166261 RepID=UPI003A5BC9C2